MLISEALELSERKIAARPAYEPWRMRDPMVAIFIVTNDGKRFFSFWAYNGCHVDPQQRPLRDDVAKPLGIGFNDWQPIEIALRDWNQANIM